jgi:hypothetical protein
VSTEGGGADLTSVERRFIDVRLRRLRALGGMTLGAYAEAVVAEALPGAVESEGGTDRIDMTWRGLAIEVKCTRGAKWGVGPSNQREEGVRVSRRRADVYVLALHAGEDHRDGWTFYVVPRWRLDDHGRKEVGLPRLHDWGVFPCDAAALADAVLAVDVAPNSITRPSRVARGPGDHWQRLLDAPRSPAGTVGLADLPTSPGVYAWFRDGEPIYAGRALTKGGIRTRVGRRHLDTSADLSHSSFRRNVCEQLLGIPTGVSRRRPSVMTVEQVAAVNEWIASCEVAWITFDDAEEAKAFERVLLAEWKPPLSKR